MKSTLKTKIVVSGLATDLEVSMAIIDRGGNDNPQSIPQSVVKRAHKATDRVAVIDDKFVALKNNDGTVTVWTGFLFPVELA